jgi:general secretion pathway protein L
MAHKILGIDLGAWSVKVAELEAGFRQTQLLGLYERPLVDKRDGESELERAARTVAALITEERLSAEMVATAMGGEAVLRLLTLPFNDPKKIEQVLGYELESQILGELDELVYDSVLSTTTPTTTNVIAVAAPRAEVRRVIDALSSVQAEPRVVGAAPLSYAALRDHAYSDEGGPQVIVDIGHRHTHVCIMLQGKIIFARAIPRGGEDVTLAIADSFKVDDPTTAKHEQAFILGAGEVAETPSHRRVDECVREAVRPLVRELRQTLAAHRAGGGAAPERMLVTGGGARLRGLVEHLEVELGMAVGRLQLDAAEAFVRPDLRSFSDGTSTALPAQALGLALAAAAPVPQVNLRKGELAYRNDYSYLRGKAGYLAVAVMSILVFAGMNAIASLRELRKEGDALEARLKRETTELFGEPRLDGKAVSEELKAGPKGGAPPIPTLTAYDVLDEISRHVPPGDKGKLDVLELDIKPKKTHVKATAESAQQVDELATALGQIECFEEIVKGKLASVTAPPSGDGAKDKQVELKQFTLDINTTCP